MERRARRRALSRPERRGAGAGPCPAGSETHALFHPMPPCSVLPLRGPMVPASLPRLGVDSRHLLVAAIGGEHASGLVVHHDQIRVLADWNFGDSGECLQIEDDDGPRIGLALTDEPAVELSRDGAAPCISAATANPTTTMAFVQIDDNDFPVMTDVQASTFGLSGVRVVPPIITRDLDALEKVITRRTKRGAYREHRDGASKWHTSESRSVSSQ